MELELHFKSFGSGQPVIIAHGLFGMLDNWQTIGRKLAETHEVFLVDMRNHGKSFHHEEFDYHVMAGDLARFIRTHNLQGAHVVGHSMGGKSVMQLALDQPVMVGKVVVVDIAPKFYPPGHSIILKAIRNLRLAEYTSRREVEEQLFAELGDMSVVRFLTKNLARKTGGGFELKMNFDVIANNYHCVQAAIYSDEPFYGETLFISGGRSPYISEDDIPGIKKLFPNAEIQVIDGAGHWVHAERPEAFLESLSSFLN